ncbi:MAG TPA: hypothetical protein VFS43_21420 [Polyangiaceae bacterium]|nr:hypothetical protein [Polyangiaceae bacterium]
MAGRGGRRRAAAALALSLLACRDRPPPEGTRPAAVAASAPSSPAPVAASAPAPSSPAAVAASAPAPPAPVAASAPAPPAPAPGGPPLGDDERRALRGRIAFVSERDGNKEVYLLDPSTLAERRLTESPLDEYPIAASPDGGELLLATADEGSGRHLEQLARLPLAGGAPAFFGPKSARVRNPSYSPDGRWVYFEADVSSYADLYRIRPDGSALRRLTRGGLRGNFSPALSPDGKSLAFVSSRDGDPEIYAADAEGAKERRLTAFHAEDWGPAWSPAGDRLAFLSSREGAEHVFVMSPSGTELRRLTAARAPADAERTAARAPGPGTDEGELAWSPAGRKLAFRAKPQGGKAKLRLYDFDEGRLVDLTDGSHSDSAPAWSPDGRYLVFVSDRDGDVDLYVMRADGSGPTRLTRAPGADWLPRWFAAPAGAGGPKLLTVVILGG